MAHGSLGGITKLLARATSDGGTLGNRTNRRVSFGRRDVAGCGIALAGPLRHLSIGPTGRARAARRSKALVATAHIGSPSDSVAKRRIVSDGAVGAAIALTSTGPASAVASARNELGSYERDLDTVRGRGRQCSRRVGVTVAALGTGRAPSLRTAR